jgi:hypothetical protein
MLIQALWRWSSGGVRRGSQPFQLSFNSSLRVDFQNSLVTSDDGLVLMRELDERPGFRGVY